MRRSHYIFFTLIVGALIFSQYDVMKRTKKSAAVSVAAAVPAKAVESAQPAAKEEVSVQVAAEPPEAFVKKFKNEVEQVGKIQNNPEQVTERLKKLADTMDKSNIDDLYEIASDDRQSGDERAMAVELLTVKNDTASLTALQNLVANTKNINGTAWDHKKEFETVLRAQAVEGIAGYPEKEIAISTLNYLSQKVDQKFLSDRISRASNSLIMGTPSLKQQDEEALKKLIE
ncbi:MAG: hypothetical protein ACXVAX_06335 [Pseudobdellovibrio sp.]